MKPPIIVDACDTVLFFESVESAELYLEPIDVKTDPIRGFDSEGRLMKPIVVEDKGPIMGTVERVRFKLIDREPEHQSELRELLIDFFSHSEKRPREQFASQSLHELVDKSQQHLTE